MKVLNTKNLVRTDTKNKGVGIEETDESILIHGGVPKKLVTRKEQHY